MADRGWSRTGHCRGFARHSTIETVPDTRARVAHILEYAHLVPGARTLGALSRVNQFVAMRKWRNWQTHQT
jgi:hypothetical protein